MNALINTLNLEIKYTARWIQLNDTLRTMQDIVAWLLDIQFIIGLYRKADTRPRMKQFGRALRQFSPYTTYHMAYAMLRDGHSIKDLYERKYMDFAAIDAAIKTARDNGILASKSKTNEQAIQAVESLSCSHCHRSALDITIRVVHALNPIVYCSDCYEAFNLD